MGLFDTVRCDYPLPVPGAKSLTYQSKSLNPAQAEYRITEEGRLMLLDRGLFTPENEAPAGVDPEDKPLPDFIGEIRFYSSWGPLDKGWIEWSSYFVRGQLRELHLIRQTDDPV